MVMSTLPFFIGWWMVLSDDGEQGYAPASLLEPVDGSNSDDEQQGEQGILALSCYCKSYVEVMPCHCLFD